MFRSIVQGDDRTRTWTFGIFRRSWRSQQLVNPMGETEANLKSGNIHGETHEYTDMYPGMARTVFREEGFDEIADWFETLAQAEKLHAGKFKKH